MCKHWLQARSELAELELLGTHLRGVVDVSSIRCCYLKIVSWRFAVGSLVCMCVGRAVILSFWSKQVCMVSLPEYLLAVQRSFVCALR